MSRTRIALVMVLLVTLAMLLVALNPQPALVELVVLQLQSRLGVLMVMSFVTGLLVGILLRATWIAELLNERGRLRRALKLAQSSVVTTNDD